MRRLIQWSLMIAVAAVVLTVFLIDLPSADQEAWVPMLKSVNTHTPIKIGHVVSLIVCEKTQRVKGFLDALAILRHSIHQNSVHVGKSAYSYQMISIVLKNSTCTRHVDLLERLGYEVILREVPVDISSIENEWYRNHVENENCCGSAEFIKLYAFTLTQYPIVVHWDLDTAVLQPMDDLFDAMLQPSSSQKGRAARSKLKIQNPGVQVIPRHIDAFFTRDVTSAKPWERVRGIQGGFLVARPNLDHFAAFQKFIHEGNYVPGRGESAGWGGLGYGGFQGAMAYQVSDLSQSHGVADSCAKPQGVLAYFYDQIHPGHSVELDVCRWNQVAADVIWRGPEQPERMGQCRQFPVEGVTDDENTPENGQCEDCRVVPLEETMTVHFTACKKPWDCVLPHPRIPGPKMKAHTYRLQQLTNVTTCTHLLSKYFNYRIDLETELGKFLGVRLTKPKGTFNPNVFKGYCDKPRQYSPLSLPPQVSMNHVYGF